MINFKTFLTEGGLATLFDTTGNPVGSQPMYTGPSHPEAIKRSERQSDLKGFLTSLSDAHKKATGKHLFGDDKNPYGALDDRSAFSGSTDAFINKTYGKGGQILSTNHGEDQDLKDRAIDYIRRRYPHHFTPEKEKELEDMKQEFYKTAREQEGARSQRKEEKTKKLQAQQNEKFK